MTLRNRPLLTAALALAALGSAAAAQARTDVQLSIGLGAPLAYVQPAPVYVAPSTVYVRPAPVYVEPSTVYVRPAPVYGYYYGEEHRHWRHHGGRRGPWGDADRDGIPNRYDRHDGFHGRGDRGDRGDGEHRHH